jgi:hypothetical protein
VLILPGYFSMPAVLSPEPFNNAKKQSQMKKLMFVLAIAAFAACNNASSDKAAADSTKMSADSTKMSADSTKMAADSTKMAADTTKKDTTTKK